MWDLNLIISQGSSPPSCHDLFWDNCLCQSFVSEIGSIKWLRFTWIQVIKVIKSSSKIFFVVVQSVSEFWSIVSMDDTGQRKYWVLLDRRVREKLHKHFYFLFLYWKYILVNMDPAWFSESQGNTAFLHQITGVSNFKPITLTLRIKTKKLYSQHNKHFKWNWGKTEKTPPNWYHLPWKVLVDYVLRKHPHTHWR